MATTSFSTVAIGNAFELHAAHFLNTDLRMAVRKVGGRGDGGVDLRGYWWLPKGRGKVKPGPPKPKSTADLIDASAPGYVEPTKPESPHTRKLIPVFIKPPGLLLRSRLPAPSIKCIRIIAQCKAERKPLGPAYVRQFEGTLVGLDDQFRSGLDAGTEAERKKLFKTMPPVMGILFSQSGFSPSAVSTASQSKVALMLVHLPGGHPTDRVASITESADDTNGEPMSVSEAESEDDQGLPCVSESGSVDDGDDNTSPPTPLPVKPRRRRSSLKTPEPSEPTELPPQSSVLSAPPLEAGEFDFGDAPIVDVGAFWWNSLVGNVIPKCVELRRELSPATSATRVGVWYFGGRMGRYGPIEQ